MFSSFVVSLSSSLVHGVCHWLCISLSVFLEFSLTDCIRRTSRAGFNVTGCCFYTRSQALAAFAIKCWCWTVTHAQLLLNSSTTRDRARRELTPVSITTINCWENTIILWLKIIYIHSYIHIHREEKGKRPSPPLYERKHPLTRTCFNFAKQRKKLRALQLYSPRQGISSLHGLLSLSEPSPRSMQLLPPYLGNGLEHFRVRQVSPPPHFTEQSLHFRHSL